MSRIFNRALSLLSRLKVDSVVRKVTRVAFSLRKQTVVPPGINLSRRETARYVISGLKKVKKRG